MGPNGTYTKFLFPEISMYLRVYILYYPPKYLTYYWLSEKHVCPISNLNPFLDIFDLPGSSF